MTNWFGRRRTGRPYRQRLLPFLERTRRRDRLFKGSILAVTTLAVLLGSASNRRARELVRNAPRSATTFLERWFGVEPPRGELTAAVRARRESQIRQARESLRRYYRGADPAMRRLFDASAMDPDHCLIAAGRADDAFMLSSQVYAADDRGRSYRLLPDTRSVWLRQITARGAPLGFFLVNDTPGVRGAAAGAGAVVEEGSLQTTNSWGLRGPEPDPGAPARCLVLGDSFMQGLFVGDADTPPARLQGDLSAVWGVPVSVLNTGHLGYAPEQYYFTLLEYGDRFRPHVVVVSVCPNDFGDGHRVMAGEGDDWEEGGYWLGMIGQWCRSRETPCLLAPVANLTQLEAFRADARYPGPVSSIARAAGVAYLDPTDPFLDEYLRLRREDLVLLPPDGRRSLYNDRIRDSHFSPLGSALWAKILARRIDLIVDPARFD